MKVTVDDHGDRELVWKHEDAAALIQSLAPGCRVEFGKVPLRSANEGHRVERSRRFTIRADRIGMQPLSVVDTYSLPFERITMEQRVRDLVANLARMVQAPSVGAI